MSAHISCGTLFPYLLAEWILLCPDADVVVIEGLLERGGGDAHLLSESLAVLKALHETTANVVLTVPLDVLRGGTV